VIHARYHAISWLQPTARHLKRDVAVYGQR